MTNIKVPIPSSNAGNLHKPKKSQVAGA